MDLFTSDLRRAVIKNWFTPDLSSAVPHPETFLSAYASNLFPYILDTACVKPLHELQSSIRDDVHDTSDTHVAKMSPFQTFCETKSPGSCDWAKSMCDKTKIEESHTHFNSVEEFDIQGYQGHAFDIIPKITDEEGKSIEVPLTDSPTGLVDTHSICDTMDAATSCGVFKKACGKTCQSPYLVSATTPTPDSDFNKVLHEGGDGVAFNWLIGRGVAKFNNGTFRKTNLLNEPDLRQQSSVGEVDFRDNMYNYKKTYSVAKRACFAAGGRLCNSLDLVYQSTYPDPKLKKVEKLPSTYFNSDFFPTWVDDLDGTGKFGSVHRARVYAKYLKDSKDKNLAYFSATDDSGMFHFNDLSYHSGGKDTNGRFYMPLIKIHAAKQDQLSGPIRCCMDNLTKNRQFYPADTANSIETYDASKGDKWHSSLLPGFLELGKAGEVRPTHALLTNLGCTKKTYEDALKTCEHYGAELCTKDELAAHYDSGMPDAIDVSSCDHRTVRGEKTWVYSGGSAVKQAFLYTPSQKTNILQDVSDGSEHVFKCCMGAQTGPKDKVYGEDEDRRQYQCVQRVDPESSKSTYYPQLAYKPDGEDAESCTDLFQELHKNKHDSENPKRGLFDADQATRTKMQQYCLSPYHDLSFDTKGGCIQYVSSRFGLPVVQSMDTRLQCASNMFRLNRNLNAQTTKELCDTTLKDCKKICLEMTLQPSLEGGAINEVDIFDSDDRCCAKYITDEPFSPEDEAKCVRVRHCQYPDDINKNGVTSLACPSHSIEYAFLTNTVFPAKLPRYCACDSSINRYGYAHNVQNVLHVKKPHVKAMHSTNLLEVSDLSKDSVRYNKGSAGLEVLVGVALKTIGADNVFKNITASGAGTARVMVTLDDSVNSIEKRNLIADKLQRVLLNSNERRFRSADKIKGQTWFNFPVYVDYRESEMTIMGFMGPDAVESGSEPKNPQMSINDKVVSKANEIGLSCTKDKFCSQQAIGEKSTPRCIFNDAKGSRVLVFTMLIFDLSVSMMAHDEQHYKQTAMAMYDAALHRDNMVGVFLITDDGVMSIDVEGNNQKLFGADQIMATKCFGTEFNSTQFIMRRTLEGAFDSFAEEKQTIITSKRCHYGGENPTYGPPCDRSSLIAESVTYAAHLKWRRKHIFSASGKYPESYHTILVSDMDDSTTITARALARDVTEKIKEIEDRQWHARLISTENFTQVFVAPKEKFTTHFSDALNALVYRVGYFDSAAAVALGALVIRGIDRSYLWVMENEHYHAADDDDDGGDDSIAEDRYYLNATGLARGCPIRRMLVWVAVAMVILAAVALAWVYLKEKFM